MSPDIQQCTIQDIGASGGFRHESMDTDKQASVDIGDLTLKVYQGDITEASVDVKSIFDD
jgi:hypothetical protein